MFIVLVGIVLVRVWRVHSLTRLRWHLLSWRLRWCPLCHCVMLAVELASVVPLFVLLFALPSVVLPFVLVSVALSSVVLLFVLPFALPSVVQPLTE